MSATILPSPFRIPSQPGGLRFGREAVVPGTDAAAGEWSVQWLLRRNCSLAPRQLLWFYVSLCAVSILIASMFWAQGVRLVMPFAWLELLALGAALLAYARHATDSESITLANDLLTVELASGSRLRRIDFQPHWVRVEPRQGDRSLIELSGPGERVAVGRFMRPELRRQLAEELRWALRRWQQRRVREAC